VISFNPKAQFQRNTEEREAWRNMAGSAILHKAITVAESQLVSSGLTLEQISGINLLVFELLNLSEDIKPQTQIPAKTLKSFDVQTPPK
jgi:hypothetical protein